MSGRESPYHGQVQTPLIRTIRVEGLFGLYTYRLPRDGSLPDAAILYGDNGAGKSTILRLAFHLLSSADNRGHRSALWEVPFRRLEVTLASGVSFVAERADQGRRCIRLSISGPNGDLGTWEYSPERTSRLEDPFHRFSKDYDAWTTVRHTVSKAQRRARLLARGEAPYMQALKENAPAVFIVNADRRLDSDLVADPSDEVELRRVMQFGEPKRINDLVVRAREIALSQALGTAARWISTRAFQGANQGSMNVHTVYVDVLQHLLTDLGERPSRLPTAASPEKLANRLTAIETKTSEYARYELATPLAMDEFKLALGMSSEGKTNVAANLLEPYVRSLESRLEALEPIYELVDRFITIVNGFLSDKLVSFTPSRGFRIANKLGVDLEPGQLSSGEQQLLLLLCYVLVARDQPSVFMIDEPEISLNIKWQRQLVQSLLDLTQGAEIQLLFASHSMELLAQHRSRVVKLEAEV